LPLVSLFILLVDLVKATIREIKVTGAVIGQTTLGRLLLVRTFYYRDRVHEWKRRWKITIGWDRATDSPHGERRQQARVDSVAELRQLIETARADPLVTVLRYTAVWEMVGTVPEHCGRGHRLDGGSATRAGVDWIICGCGGHVVYACKMPSCGDRVIDPVPSWDCDPSR
jgi:hypothetical protein